MASFATNAQENALVEIAKQMRINNSYILLRELWSNDAIKDSEYLKKVQELLDCT